MTCSLEKAQKKKAKEMFAIIRTGGKQYKVSKGERLWVEKLEEKAGEQVSISDVLMIHDGKEARIGSPLVEGASVALTVLDQTRAKKVIIFKKRRRQNSRRKNGHRQHQTVLKVENLFLDGKALVSEVKEETSSENKTKKSSSSVSKVSGEKEKVSPKEKKTVKSDKPSKVSKKSEKEKE